MIKEQILQEAESMRSELIEKRRYIHQNPETGFDVTNTLAFVMSELKSMGYEPELCGKAGIVATVGKGQSRVFMLRADMDALPIQEETGLAFASGNNCAHACGHDIHTVMLLGAAKILKKYEHAINGTVKLMFQSAEEIFEGAHDMIENGLLDNPSVDAACMLHVMANVPFQTGTAIVCSAGVSAPAADYFEIHVKGSGCHGSMPNVGVDPIQVAAHILIAMQEINARELAASESAVLTIGTFHSGSIANVIPDSAIMGGTLRTYNEETREFIKKRMKEIAEGVAKTFRAEAELTFGSGCPTLVNDRALSECVAKYTAELLGKKMSFTVEQLNHMSGAGQTSKSAGSEDFAYVSHEVPSIMLAVAAGQPQKGYCYPQHHQKVMFDEEVLTIGSSIYAYIALRWLEEHAV